MANLVVEENVPRPKSIPEIIADLTPGQSVLIPPEMMTLRSVQTSVWRIRDKFKQRNYRTSQEGTGVRVWREEDKAEGEEPKDDE